MFAQLTGSVYPRPYQGASPWTPDDKPTPVFEASFAKPVTVELLCRTGNYPGQTSDEAAASLRGYFVKVRYPGGVGYASPPYVDGLNLDLNRLPEC